MLKVQHSSTYTHTGKIGRARRETGWYCCGSDVSPNLSAGFNVRVSLEGASRSIDLTGDVDNVGISFSLSAG